MRFLIFDFRFAIDHGDRAPRDAGVPLPFNQKSKIKNQKFSPAFSLVEVVVSTLIVSMLFVASLSAVSASRAARQTLADQARGDQLAHDLLSEVLGHGYYEPDGADNLGPLAGELTGNRTLFDDADDYHGWTDSPPQNRDGTAIAGFDGWTREVAVAYVNPLNPAAAANSTQRAKLITVTVKRGDRVVSRVRAIRTAAMSEMEANGVLP